MQTIKEKVSNAASSGKAHVDIYKAKAEEKAEKAAARTAEEKEIAHQRRKAKEAKAKMEMHEAKAEHAAEKLRANQTRHLCNCCPNLTGGTHLADHQPPPVVPNTATHVHGQGHHPVGVAANPITGTAMPTYPLGGNPAPRSRDDLV